MIRALIGGGEFVLATALERHAPVHARLAGSALEAVERCRDDPAGARAATRAGRRYDAGAGSQAERVQVAMDLFGRSGAGMVNMLADGAEGLRDARAAAEAPSAWRSRASTPSRSSRPTTPLSST
jgi:hypothetical protein